MDVVGGAEEVRTVYSERNLQPDADYDRYKDFVHIQLDTGLSNIKKYRSCVCDVNSAKLLAL